MKQVPQEYDAFVVSYPSINLLDQLDILVNTFVSFLQWSYNIPH